MNDCYEVQERGKLMIIFQAAAVIIDRREVLDQLMKLKSDKLECRFFLSLIFFFDGKNIDFFFRE